MPPFVLVDGSYFLFRAFHALPPLTTSTGLHTNAIRGAISAIQKLMRRTQPTHMAVIFDTPEPTFRHKLSPIYKGDRPSMPEELSQQIPYLHALIKAQGENLRTFSHITGGGLADNTARVIPAGLTAIYDRSTWSLPAEVKFLSEVAAVPQADMERTWNCGIGMSAIVDPAVGELVIRSLAARGMKAWIAGVVEPASDSQAPRSYLTSAYKG